MPAIVTGEVIFHCGFDLHNSNYFGHLMRRVDSLEKTDARRDWGQEEKGSTDDRG